MKLKYIRKLFDKWTYRLGLRWWSLCLVYKEDPQDIIETFGHVENSIVIAKTFCDWRYGTATIYFNLPKLKQMSKEDIEHVIIHELCHILVNEMREGEIHHEERVVTGLTKAFLWTEKDTESRND